LHYFSFSDKSKIKFPVFYLCYGIFFIVIGGVREDDGRLSMRDDGKYLYLHHLVLFWFVFLNGIDGTDEGRPRQGVWLVVKDMILLDLPLSYLFSFVTMSLVGYGLLSKRESMVMGRRYAFRYSLRLYRPPTQAC